jgi:poly(ADP-ribose) glycohydrolase ARH3
MDADRARGALLGTFVGDALGMPFEGAAPDALPERPEMEEARLGRGTYTDDTQMMIALAESLVACGAVDEDHLAGAFLAAYEPERGYGAGTRAVLRLLSAGVPAREAAARVFDGRGSLGNGAAMRVAPVAVRFAVDKGRLLEQAERSARVTHAHLLGVDGARVQAAAIGAALRGEDVLVAARESALTAELRHRVDAVETLLGEASNADTLSPGKQPSQRPVSLARAVELLGNGSAAMESVPTAIYAALAHDHFEEAVAFAVSCGGDTDTIAAMAGAIAGARDGASAIPARWLDALEDGSKGRTYVQGLAERLIGNARTSL